MYSVVKAAELLDIPSGQLARWVARGRIPTAVLVDGPSGKVWRLPRQTVDSIADRLSRVEQPPHRGPVATARPPEADRQARSPKHHRPQVRWQQVEKIVANERVHWERLSQLQTDTISGLRNQLEDANNELMHLRERLADHANGERDNALLGRSTLPIGRSNLVEIGFPQLEMG